MGYDSIVSAMDYYPVYQLAKSNFERRMEATWNNQSSRVRFLSIACTNFHDRQHLSQYFATLHISYPVRTKALFHDETVAGACTRHSIFNLAHKYTCIFTSTSPGPVWTREKISSPPGFPPRAVHPLASRYSLHMNTFLRSRKHHCNKYQVSK